jgi:LuxR family transcriptional regulator, maltose regulon positive regulatory protein
MSVTTSLNANGYHNDHGYLTVQILRLPPSWYNECRWKPTQGGSLMETMLLATKLRVPPQPYRLVHRPRLIGALERGIPHYKLTHISAPAGYGKTTLLSQWAHSSQFPVAWLSISEEDSDPERFLRYLLRAWEIVQPGIMESKPGLLLGSMRPEREAVLSAFINAADELSDHIVFVLDDYHLIESPGIHEILISLLDHLPRLLHFIVAGRGEPPLPLARYRARQELLEFRAEDLRFLPEETDDFLNSLLNLDLAEDKLNLLQYQTEGWITGLQLVALTLRQRSTNESVFALSGKHRFIADYLSQDVLPALGAEVRHFLMQTSIVDRLCASLCDAITDSENSQLILETLERDRLFVMLLDDNREWFRYHRLFGEFLHEELKRQYPDEVAILHRRAARWYLDHDLPEQAFQHTIAGADVQLMTQIFDRYCSAKLNGGEIRVVEQWVEAIPAAWYTAYPVLRIAQVGVLAFTGAFETCMQHLSEVEYALTSAASEERDWQLARVTAVRCMMACMQNDLTQAETYADHALQALPEEDPAWRPGIFVALGDTYRHHGHWEQAEACYVRALSVTSLPQIQFMAAHVFGALADLALRQGGLREADGYWKKALAVIQEPRNWGHLSLPLTGWVYIRLGEVLYEWNELAQAWEYLSQGLERVELGGDVRALIAGYLIAGRLKLTEGDNEAAVDYLEKARPLVENAQFSHWKSRFERLQLEIWLALDRLRAAVDWSDTMLRDASIEDQPESEVAQLAMARVLIVKGDAPSLGRAVSLLERLLQDAEAQGRMSIAIETLALQALAHWKQGERPGALTVIERALRLAEPEGYVRLFANLGLPMARLLQEARSRDVLSDYVDRLLGAFGAESADSPEATLPEPLTEREQEILELIAAGLTNQEVADKLVISPETVKKHAGNIYGKLGVSNRTEATARARELDLLG